LTCHNLAGTFKIYNLEFQNLQKTREAFKIEKTCFNIYKIFSGARFGRGLMEIFAYLRMQILQI